MSKPIMEYTLAAMPKVQSFQSAVPDGAVADDEQDEFEKELLEELEEHKALEQARNNWVSGSCPWARRLML